MVCGIVGIGRYDTVIPTTLTSTLSMSSADPLREQTALLGALVKWLALAIPLGGIVGSAVALFLWSLDWATAARLSHPWLLWMLPVAGAGIGWLYRSLGESVEGGNNLVVEQIHDDGGAIPLRIAPLVLIGTVATHLCGGSAGREGTAVQMGAGLAAGLIRWAPWLERRDIPLVIMAGVAAGFGGVFGTPVAGMLFALEVPTIGRMRYAAIVPCLAAAIAADRTCTAWGIHHTPYPTITLESPTLPLLILCGMGGVVFGLASRVFAESVHAAHSFFSWLLPSTVLRPAVGGCLILALTWLVGTRDYLGLGVASPNPSDITILSAFSSGGADRWSWLAKILFTAITLGAGFKGGEVTPLFYVGATLGNALALAMGLSTDLFAALGFVAVFAGAANTPLACTVMAVELFGGDILVPATVACVTAYLASGHSGIYLSQRIETPKTSHTPWHPDASLRSVRSTVTSSASAMATIMPRGNDS